MRCSGALSRREVVYRLRESHAVSPPRLLEFNWRSGAPTKTVLRYFDQRAFIADARAGRSPNAGDSCGSAAAAGATGKNASRPRSGLKEQLETLGGEGVSPILGNTEADGEALTRY